MTIHRSVAIPHGRAESTYSQRGWAHAGLQWLVRRMTDKQGLFVELEMEEDGDLPQDIKVLLFESVRELFSTLSNTPTTRGPPLRSMCDTSDYMRVMVADKGIGFDPAAMPAAGEGGRGFGLFSIQERVELMGGTLTIESNPGQGSRFVVSLPLAASTQTTSLPVQEKYLSLEAQATPSPHSNPECKIRVMLADDHAVVRQGIANLLDDQADMEVIAEAADGQEAVDLAAKMLPDIILMDMSMPKLNGVEATRIIHNDWPGIRIIGLSMFEEADRAQAIRDAGAIDYITKSGPAEKLINAIRASTRESNKTTAVRN